MSLNHIKSKLRNYHFLFQILKRFYRFVYLPVVSGHLLYNIKYGLFYKRNEISLLESYGLKSVKPFKQNVWRIGRSADRALRRYYTAKFNDHDCFVKIASGDRTVENEILLYKSAINIHQFTFSPQCYLCDFIKSKNQCVLATEYIEDLHPIDIKQTYEGIVNITRQFIAILDHLNDCQVVHADIHRGNIMLDHNNRLVLMDYGISKIVNVDNNVNYVERPGTFYKKDGLYRIYDDAYSFVKLLELLDVPSSFYDSFEFKEIQKRNGRCFIKVNTNGK